MIWGCMSWNRVGTLIEVQGKMDAMQDYEILEEGVEDVGAHMLICIYAQSQSKYILVFSSILFLYHILFIVCTLFQFFSKF